ncbi:hypothetical protein GDO81_007023 [Engystomops pustulosus]|uniref:Uncharacterized protein n=1 Tax=Engystomops pustulosus TaxID=76066 RepID=A0AAV7D0T8_ENGPU|nr:hypothetical protein GDO81_007023 [Engystomops pustulosus]
MQNAECGSNYLCAIITRELMSYCLPLVQKVLPSSFSFCRSGKILDVSPSSHYNFLLQFLAKKGLHVPSCSLGKDFCNYWIYLGQRSARTLGDLGGGSLWRW